MTNDGNPAGTPAKEQTTAAALTEWREAERTVAVARRGRVAAQAAMEAAELATQAAQKTADAAKSALESAALAEASAAETARAARAVAHSTRDDITTSDDENAQADLGEFQSHERYRQAVDRVDRAAGSTPGG